MDTSSKRCMCRKGFTVPNPDINKEQFRCVRNVDINLMVGAGGSKPTMMSPAMISQSTKTPNFKVQALQGKCNDLHRPGMLGIALLSTCQVNKKLIMLLILSTLVRCVSENDCKGVANSKCNYDSAKSNWRNSFGHCECMKGKMRGTNC